VTAASEKGRSVKEDLSLRASPSTHEPIVVKEVVLGRSAARLVLALVAAGAIVRTALALPIGLSVDESYAVVMSRHLALSYYDHPPLLFWIPGVAARLAGSEHRIVVRLPFILMFMATTWLVYRLGSLLFGERAGLWAAVALNLGLFFTVNAASWVLPDGPLLLFSTAAVWFVARATLSRVRQSEGREPGGGALAPPPARLGPWLGFGVFTGLALLSKYHGAFLLVGCGLFLVTSKPHRVCLRRPGPYIALLLALVVFLPVVIWNADHDWASFRFQGSRAIPVEEAQGTPFLDTIIGQAAWMLPWLWVPLLGVLFWALRSGPRDPARWLLTCIALGPIAFFTLLTAVGSRGLPHWEAPGYFMLLPLLGASIAARLERGDRRTRQWLWASSAGLLVVLLLIVTHASTGWLARAVPGLFSKGDPTRDLLQWSLLPARLREWGYPQPGLAIAAASWSDVAKAAYALGPEVTVSCVGTDPRGFRYQANQGSLVGQDVLLLASRRAGQEPMVSYAPYFEHITAVGTVPVWRRGREEIAVSVYLCRRLLRPVPPGLPR
jgi:hypothetical protein